MKDLKRALEQRANRSPGAGSERLRQSVAFTLAERNGTRSGRLEGRIRGLAIATMSAVVVLVALGGVAWYLGGHRPVASRPTPMVVTSTPPATAVPTTSAPTTSTTNTTATPAVEPGTLELLEEPPLPLDTWLNPTGQTTAVPARGWLVMVGRTELGTEVEGGEENTYHADAAGTFVYAPSEDAWYRMQTSSSTADRPRRGWVFPTRSGSELGMLGVPAATGLGTRSLWSLDLDTGSWKRVAAVPVTPDGVTYDPTTNQVITITQKRIATADEIPENWVSLVACQCAKVWQATIFDYATGLWRNGAEIPEPTDARQTAAVYDPVGDREIVLQHVADPYTSHEPSLKVVRVWAYDVAADRWEQLPAPETSGTDAGLWQVPPVVDGAGKRLIVFAEATTFVFDLTSETWTQVDVSNRPEIAAATYDEAHATVYAVARDGTVWTYDPEANVWAGVGG